MAFPFQSGSTTFPQQANDDAAIQASLIQIVTVGKRERVMRPSFGCDAFSFVFEGDTDLFRRQIQRQVMTAISIWEPRVVVLAIDVTSSSGVTPGQMLITVTYRRNTSTQVQAVTIGGGP